MRLRPTPEEAAEQERLRMQARDRDRVLVARLQAGEPQALASLMAEYTNRLVKFAFSVLGSRDAAEDVVQQVFMDLWDRRMALAPDSYFKAYLFRLVRNRLLDEQKALAVRERYKAAARVNESPSVAGAFVPSPEADILMNASFQKALEQLSERRRLAIRLRLQEEMTHAEIGEVIGITPLAAQLLVSRALNEIRRILWED